MELTAEKMVAGGDALARAGDGRAVMLSGALPGERVQAREVLRKRHFLRAETVAVLEPAAERCAPPCPQVARGCGGCDWQHVSPPAQLELKRAVAEDALVRIARIEHVPVNQGAAVPPWAYRTTLRLALDRHGVPGFRASRSHRVVTTDACPVAHPALEALLPSLRLPGARELTLRVGAGTGERLAWWRPESVAAPADLPADVAAGPDAAVHELVHGVRLRVSARAFFQSSPQAAELLADAVRRAAGPRGAWEHGPVLDAYGGIGALSAVATDEVPVMLVEANDAACADAAVNLSHRLIGVDNVAVEEWRVRPAGLVIADPARAGLGREAAARLAATGASRLVLVSCDAGAFARDVGLLNAFGYGLESVEVLDLFPNTHHLEVVSGFQRR